jgi:hypothetical protein
MILCLTEPLDVTVEYFQVQSARRPPSEQRAYKTIDGPPTRPSRTIARRRRLELKPVDAGIPYSGLYVVPDGHSLESFTVILQDAGIPMSVVKRIKGLTFSDMAKALGLSLLTTGLDINHIKRRELVHIAIGLPCLAYGDALATISALKCFKEELEEGGINCRLTLITNPCTDVEPLYMMCDVIDEIRYFPFAVTDLYAIDTFIDLTSMSMGRNTSLVDSVLSALGVSPTAVEEKRKRIPSLQLPLNETIHRLAARARQTHGRLLFLSPSASSDIRTMPPFALQAIIDSVAAISDWTLVTAVKSLQNKNVLNWSSVSQCFTDFMAIIGECDAVITVDTSALYVADYFDKPTLAFFVNNIGAVWSAPYPFINPIQVGSPGPLAAVHASSDADLIAYSHKQWSTLDLNTILSEFIIAQIH